MNTKYKETGAEMTTITYDKKQVETATGNIYEAIVVVAKRARQINTDLKKEIEDKMQDFTFQNESIVEEIFENKEQIDLSKFYEKLPKAHAIALKEWLTEKLYYRY